MTWARKWGWLPLFWVVCVTAGYLYSQQKGVPWNVARMAAPAFLLEATLFLALGIERWRAKLEKLPPAAVSCLLILAAVAPYLTAALTFRTFSWSHFGAIAALAAVLAFWYVVLPRNPLADVGLLAFAAAVVLSRIFKDLYVRPNDRLALEALGQAMWIRTGLFAVLSVRRVKGVGFGFWPQAREWAIGVACFVAFLPVAWAVGKSLKFTQFHGLEAGWPTLLPLTFFGALWVLALGEELFFRGLLQHWLSQWLHNEWAGLVAASAVFGAAHLWYDWRLAVLAGIAGLFYGFAFMKGRGIRAAMVTHALTVTTLKMFVTLTAIS